MPLTTPPLLSFLFSSATSAGHSPADATTYYFGLQPSLAPITVSTGVVWPVIVPRTGNIVEVIFNLLVTGILGSAGNIAITIRNTTAGTTESVGNIAATASAQFLTNNGMTLAVTAGDRLEIQMLTPTWATNPTAVFYAATVVIQG